MDNSGRGKRLLLVGDGVDAEPLRERAPGGIVVEPTAAGALEVLERDSGVGCVVSEYRLPDGDALELLASVRERAPALPFVLWTARGDEAVASEAIDAGVSDYIVRGETPDAAAARRIVSHVSRRNRYEETLEELNHAVKEFHSAQTDHDIAKLIVDIATTVLDLSGVGVFRYNDEKGQLEPAAHSRHLRDLIGEPPTFTPGDSIAWRVYTTGETEAFDDVRTDDDVFNPATVFRSEIALPLGDYGVVLVGDTEPAAFDDVTVDLAEVLAATAESAFDRVERTERLQRQKREYRRRIQRLERVDQLNEKLRETIRAVVGADTRLEIEEAICERFADTDRFAFAWTGEVDHVDEAVTPTAWAGTAPEYLESVSLSLDDERPEPTVQAVRERETTVVGTVAETVQREPWRQTALLSELRSALAVPLIHDGTLYGTLSVYGAQTGTFDEHSAPVLTELGELVGYAIHAVEQRHAILEPDAVELTFQLPESTDTFGRLASRLGTELAVSNVSARRDGSFLVQLSAEGVDPEEFVKAAEELLVVDDLRTVSDADPAVFEVIVSGPSLVTEVADLAATSHSLVLSEAGGQITVSLPEDRDVRSFVERFRENHPDATVARQKGVERQSMRRRRPGALLEGLSPRQREVLRTAYFGGFFDQPRKSTGTEVANALGISQPAFSKQLRRCERALLKPLYEPE